MRKYESLAQQIDLKPGQSVLEIGCGWGGFAEYAAKTYGANITGLTISQEQHDYARKRMFDAGLADKVTIKMQDYRDETGIYDRIASIEMIEAVGEQFWPDFFRQMRDRLAAGGMAGIQAITIQERFFLNYRREIDYIRRYVFPGGMLPSPTILKSLGSNFGIPLVREKVFGDDYARTLSVWRDRFRAAWPSLVPLGFDERFRRLWEYYLAYCEAGFLSRNIDVRQMIFAKEGVAAAALRQLSNSQVSSSLLACPDGEPVPLRLAMLRLLAAEIPRESSAPRIIAEPLLPQRGSGAP